ncbi:MAG: HAD-IA family hydrolase [Bacteroidales bacterium]|nr:HAD-IA family hydrolase [Bacteroidales bacterium]
MQNIIFDFGNVLVRWQPDKVYNEYFGDEARTWWFFRHVCEADWRNRIDAGESQDACIAECQARFPEYSEAIGLYRDRWREMLTGEVEGMREVIEDLKHTPDVRLFGLTNWSMETFPEARERFGILQEIEHYVVSGAERLVKPDPAIFQVLLDRYGLKAGDCTFIDDNEANVRTAESLGMRGIVFRNATELRRRLDLYRALRPDEVARLEAQGNRCDDWTAVRVSDGIALDRLWHNRFIGSIRLGRVGRIADSRLENCAIADDTTVEDVRRLAGYRIGRRCRLFNIGEMSYAQDGDIRLEVMNENGGRWVHPCEGMTVGDAYLWARYRDRKPLMQRLDAWSTPRPEGPLGTVGDGVEIRNCTAILDGHIGDGCRLEHGIIAERFLLGENVKLEYGLRLNDTVVGDNSTLARGEVGNSIIFPAHEQHHNSSFLIAALVQGQSNVASGATLGSNHNGRTPDGELSAGRGFWPGLCVSVKHSSRFASYTLMAKGDYPSELNITLPFALVNNNVAKNRLEVMPAYWWMYNMYALNRNITKFAKRDRRTLRRQHIEFSPFAPDTAEEMLVARELLYMWTTKAYQEGGGTEVEAYGMEKGKRKALILKPGDAYKAYEEMLVYYAMSALQGSRPTLEGPRERRWVNVGGQLVPGSEMDRMLEEMEKGVLTGWDDVHKRMDALWAEYPEQKMRHAYGVLCQLAQKQQLDEADWRHFGHEYTRIQQLVRDRIAESRQKDADNEFRQATYWNMEEMRTVLGE